MLTAWTVAVGVAAVLVLWPEGPGGNAGGVVTPGPHVAVPTSASQAPAAGPSEPPTQRRYWVDTFTDAEGHREPGAGPPVGVLRAGTHYVFCKVWGPRRSRGDAHNHWWLLTDLDEVYSGGGPRAYVPALYLTHWGDDEAKDNDGVEIPTCPS
ncbi:hypothetical protein [Thermomonospora amylolytica]|uniref:hypothetical protein n=1 Tax=Thermomonospora amylolytica TaxID=1411117 RepID=UPI001300597F|nr:hypothetical protein [Thermomonospora amylolytica]